MCLFQTLFFWHLILEHIFTLWHVQGVSTLKDLLWQSHPSQKLKWQKYGQFEFVMDDGLPNLHHVCTEFFKENFKSTLWRRKKISPMLVYFFVGVLLTWLICYGSFSTYNRFILYSILTNNKHHEWKLPDVNF